MNKPSNNPNDQQPERVRLVQDLITRLSAASKKRGSPDEFYRQVIGELNTCIDLSAAYVWIVTTTELHLVDSLPVLSSESVDELQIGRFESCRRLLSAESDLLEVVEAADRRLNSINGDQGGEEVGFQSYACRLLHDGDRAIVLELIAADSTDLKSPLVEGLVGAIREIAEDFHRNYELEKLRASQRRDNRLIAFSQRLLEIVKPEELNFEIVNSAVDILGVDRASILARRGRNNSVLAVSGVSTLNHHSESIQTIEDYAAQGIEAGVPVQIRDDKNSATITVVAVAPEENSSNESQTNQYLLVLEYFHVDSSKICSQEAVNNFAALVYSAKQKNSQSGSSRVLQSLRSNSAKLFLGIAILLTLVLCLVPTKLDIRAEGKIIPRIERGIFAPTDGEVVDIKVGHNDRVDQNEILIVIQSPDLELKLTELRGQRQATLERIRAIEAENAKGNDSSNRQKESSYLESASIKELEILEASQLKQLTILEEQQRSLTIRSPIKGRVTTWQLDQLLKGRQVKQGQLLLSVAAEEQGWQAEISIRDHRVGHVLRRIEQESQPGTECMLLSDPDKRYVGKLISVAGATTTDYAQQPIVNAIAEYDFPQDSNMRSGAKIIVTIDCGNRSLGYVYFHEVYHSILSFLF